MSVSDSEFNLDSLLKDLEIVDQEDDITNSSQMLVPRRPDSKKINEKMNPKLRVASFSQRSFNNLNEVEEVQPYNQYSRDVIDSRNIPKSNSTNRITSVSPLSEDEHSLDDPLDISASPNTCHKIYCAIQSSSNNSYSNGSSNKKCTRAILGGANFARGHKSSAFSKCICDNLRCLQCNFQVCCFNRAKWNESVVEYMFFRNNTPNAMKLSRGLTDSEITAAYCCQCSWTNAEEEIVLTAAGGTGNLQWVCAGH